MSEIQTEEVNARPVLIDSPKHLTFRIGGEEFAVEIGRVQEIIGMVPITRLPRMEAYVRGVINLRGRIIPTIDLRIRLGLNNPEDTVRTCIVVVEILGIHEEMVRMGLVVDEVADVLDIPPERIQATDEAGGILQGEFLKGIGLVDEEVKLLLDVDRVISAQQVTHIERMAEMQADPTPN